jgi:hypothetical protein
MNQYNKPCFDSNSTGFEKEHYARFHSSKPSLSDPLEYVKPGADRLDPDDREVDINDMPYQDFSKERMNRVMGEYSVVGKSVERTDGRVKVTGGASHVYQETAEI